MSHDMHACIGDFTSPPGSPSVRKKVEKRKLTGELKSMVREIELRHIVHIFGGDNPSLGARYMYRLISKENAILLRRPWVSLMMSSRNWIE